MVVELIIISTKLNTEFCKTIIKIDKKLQICTDEFIRTFNLQINSSLNVFGLKRYFVLKRGKQKGKLGLSKEKA